MKNLNIVLFITAVLLVSTASNVKAQSRAEKTSSAKAYYGYSSSKPKFKKKKQKVTKGHAKKAKGTRVNVRSTRRKNGIS